MYLSIYISMHIHIYARTHAYLWPKIPHQHMRYLILAPLLYLILTDSAHAAL